MFSLLRKSEASNYQHFQRRDWADLINHVKLELSIALQEWKILVPCILMQYFHSVFHNWAYYIQGNVLSVEQRVMLYDLGYALMPELTGTAAHLSEYLVFGAVFAPTILLILSVLVLKQNPLRPRFIAIILKRLLLQISIALVLRVCSFMITSLPSPAEHCRLVFDEACKAANPNDYMKCVIPNPDFEPPTVSQFFIKIDALRGCGDLMFSSHTIYTLSLILSVCKYWPHPLLISVMVSVQIAIAFLIVASRKHYSIDVFTALYVVPMIWLLLDAYMHDVNHKDVIITPKVVHDFYGIDLSETNATEVNSNLSTQLESAHVTLIEEGRLHDQGHSEEGHVPLDKRTSFQSS